MFGNTAEYAEQSSSLIIPNNQDPGQNPLTIDRENPQRFWQGISIYDTSYLLRVQSPLVLGEDERNSLFNEMLKMQHEDGSWGESAITPHAALMDTLGMMHLLYTTEYPENYQQKLDAGWGALNRLLAESSPDNYPKHETVALELIVPPLVEFIAGKRSQMENLSVQERIEMTLNSLAPNAVNYYLQLKSEQGKKIQMMQELSESGTICTPGTTGAHCAEILETMAKVGSIGYDSPDIKRLDKHNRGEYGVGLSPAATVAAIVLHEELGQEVPQQYYDFLKLAYKAQNGEGVAGTYPFTNTDKLWIDIQAMVNNDEEFFAEPRMLDALDKIIKHIDTNNGKGISWTNEQDIPDLDDTVLALEYARRLRSSGKQVRSDINMKLLYNFLEDNIRFICYPGEMTTSPSHLYHLVYYLNNLREGAKKDTKAYVEVARLRSIAMDQLNSVINTDAFSAVDDKWYTGEGYTFDRAVTLPAMVYRNPELVQLMIARAVNAQLPDGGFGTERYKSSLVEESIYIYSGLTNLLSLINRDPRLELVYADQISAIESTLTKVTIFLDEKMRSGDEGFDDPKQWIAKGTYRSIAMQKALVNSYRRMRFQELNNGYTNGNNADGESPTEVSAVRRDIMKNTEAIWNIVTKVSGGTRNHGDARSAKAIAHVLLSGLDLNIGRGVAASVDPMMFNKVVEQLADMNKGVDKLYVEMLLDAAKSGNWKDYAHIKAEEVDFMKFPLFRPIYEQNPALGNAFLLSMRQIAAIGLGARESINKNSPEFTQQWEELYTKMMTVNYAQELKKDKLDPAVKKVPVVVDQNGTGITDAYLAQYGQTSALGVAIIGAIAHRETPLTKELFDFLQGEDFEYIINVSRFVQDINSVDPTERINVGMWLYCYENKLSIQEAREALTKGYTNPALYGYSVEGTVGNTLREGISLRLADIYKSHYLPILFEMKNRYQQSGTREGEYIAKLIDNLMKVDQLILDLKKPKKAH